MSTVTEIIAYAGEKQRQATRPNQSAWVVANAGTGKTKVLTDRVTRLLLAEVKPERILCLTFTKAAAAEMRNRLASQLGRWAMADDATLDKEVEKLIDRPPEPAERTIARRLFARVLDAPGGINILTIHAFCQALLKRFPLEAGVAPGFEVLDETDAATLLRQAQDEQVAALARDDAPAALRDALAAVANKVSIGEYAELMGKMLSERAWLLERIGSDKSLAQFRQRLARQLKCDKPLASAPDETALRRAVRVLVAGGKTDSARGEAITVWLNAKDRSAAQDDYQSAFFTGTGDIRKTLASKPAIKAMDDIVEVLTVEAERLQAERNHQAGCALVELTVSLLQLAVDITERYGRAKRRRSTLDYDDLIVATRRLLATSASAAWVLYKLDGGIDHVLVDEAQDTNPDQWEVIASLTEEFFSGESAVDRDRTIFAVGDTKQSIFGFQRADPRKLAEMRDTFEMKIGLIHKAFVSVGLDISFRSTPAVLAAVDWVFSQPETAKGLVEESGEVLHHASRKDAPGLVELWPLVQGDGSDVDTLDVTATRAQLTSSIDPHQRLARITALHIKGLVGVEKRAKDGAPLHAGHFMVLVRRRNEFVGALVQQLKRAGIGVAGVDRLNLGEELAIQDLLAMARFVLLPQDDLNLACLLKSPLIGLDEDRLFTLAYDRKGHLWRSLRDKKASDPEFARAHAILSRWLARADYTTPFDFFAQALGPEHGRRNLLERLGREASDPIDELLARALQYQGAEAGSLQGFLRWFEEGGGEIKRDLDANRRPEVRILTVHASKGLQAPIVYLPDTTRVPPAGERILPEPRNLTRLWLPRTDDANDAARAWRNDVRERSLEEQNRLLYVAMTRAEDRLYVLGYINSKRQDPGCWYDRIAAGLAASVDGEGPAERVRAAEHAFDFTTLDATAGWTGDGFRLANAGQMPENDEPELALETTVKLEAWATKPAPPEADPPTPLAPSQPLPDEATDAPRAFSPSDTGDAKRWKRGLLLHELLRHLPSLPPARRAEAARRYLSQAAHGLAPEEITDWAKEALAVTEAPAHAALFAQGSRAEVPLIGTVKTSRGTFTVSGQVDRLAVSEREVLIVDYKTNRPPPASAEDVALAYRRQLALYRALLQEIYPGRTVRAFLLWTAAPRLMEIDAKSLDKSMPYAAAS
jgi:ATP-dependent helicase/nuclease subunit A